jgi:hypothetical protein
MEDLFKLVDEEIREGNEVMIAGDFNLETKERDAIFDEMRVRELKNCMETLYGNQLPPTREPYVLNEKKSPIDHIYTTSGFMMKEGCIGPFLEGSDHSYIIMDFFAEPMFYKQTWEPPPTSRMIHSSKPKRIPRFRNLLDNGIREKGIMESLETLQKKVLQNTAGPEDRALFSTIVQDLDNLTLASSGSPLILRKRKGALNMNRKVIIWRQVIGWLKSPTQKKAVIKKKLKSIGEKEAVLSSLTLEQAREH